MDNEGSQNYLIRFCLRLLTPEEINLFTTTSISNKKVPLTELIEGEVDGIVYDYAERNFEKKGAKILPFRSKSRITIKSEHQCSEAAISLINNFGVVSEEDFDESVASEKQLEDNSVFILEEKRRFKKSQTKLKGAEILQLYEKNARVDIEQEKAIKDDMNQSTQSGVLVNKRQF